MSANDEPDQKGIDESLELELRDVRALIEYHSVLPEIGQVRDADDLYLVVSQSGSEYVVDLRPDSGRCTCPDHEYRDVECKHIRRAKFATGQKPIPSWVNADAVDPQIGEHVNPKVATDGGQTRPDDCTCCNWTLEQGPPCFHCYRVGFRTPAVGSE